MRAKDQAAAIRFIMGRVHVGTPDATVEADIRARVARGRTGGQRCSVATENALVRMALAQHKRNREEYATVMGGFRSARVRRALASR